MTLPAGLLLFAACFAGQTGATANPFNHHVVLRKRVVDEETKSTSKMLQGFFGGSLISADWILTAGTTIVNHDAIELEASYGVSDFVTARDVQWKPISTIKLPPNFESSPDNTFFKNNYGLLRLATPAVMSDTVGVINLPRMNDFILPVSPYETINVDLLTTGTSWDFFRCDLGQIKLRHGRMRHRPMIDCGEYRRQFSGNSMCFSPVSNWTHGEKDCAGDPGSGLIGNPRCGQPTNILAGIVTDPIRRFYSPDTCETCGFDVPNRVTILTPEVVQWVAKTTGMKTDTEPRRCQTGWSTPTKYCRAM